MIQEENDNSLAIKIGNQPDTLIRKKDIAERKNSPLSMPDMRHLLTEREIRDLVGYLSTLERDEMNSMKTEEKSQVYGD